MRPGARTPEELETLLEDAFLARDDQALCEMFEQDAVLVAGNPAREARGAKEIGRLARTIWDSDRNYIADPQRVVQARDTAVVLANGGINVVRRGSDGEWRYAIALLAHEETAHEEEEK
jgi:ketosteroid isomerase-like protein